mmetsp:Transcript_43947/g.87162  ORF Transcript_43947/g.87162 Transcript_43947/m.87162 type:complete len:342 (-) Transcript_43947:44-1069(-)
MANNSLFCASLATQSVALAVFLYEGFAYNMVYLRRILPAVGKAALIPPFAILFNLSWGLAIWSYMKAHWVDPGTVPQRWQDWVRSMGDALPVAPARPEWQPGKATYCKKCDVPRPERAHHCLICEVCVLRMDHHCPWLNNCVGFNNQKFFLLLGIYACLASLVGLATALPELWYCAAATASLEDGFLTFGEHGDVGTSDALVFLIFGLLALFAAFLLAPMLATHLPLAVQNCTTIEDNYENMPNPFDQGTTATNLAQVFGGYGPDWLLPVAPWKPLSDGVSFARSDERLGPDGLPERNGVGGNGEDVEELWRIRYQVRSPQNVASDNGPLVSLARWWTGDA